MYIRFDSSSKSLTKRALAELIEKIISFLNGGVHTRSEIEKELNGFLGTTISNEKIEAAFELLLSENKISESKGKYSIDPKKKIQIEAAHNEFISRQNRVIEKFLSNAATEKNFILQWFEDVTIEFFKEYSAEWISDLCLNANSAVKKNIMAYRLF